VESAARLTTVSKINGAIRKLSEAEKKASFRQPVVQRK
jgi:hypothetical protein